MLVRSRALNFALNTTLVDEKQKNDIFHIISVGDILRRYGYDDNIVAAGYLHEVIENGSYTVDEIAKIFNGKITSYLLTTALPQENLPENIRLKQLKKLIEGLPDDNKAIICADYLTDIILKEELTSEELSFYINVFNFLQNDYYSPLLERLYDEINKKINRQNTSAEKSKSKEQINHFHALKKSLKSKQDYIICFNYPQDNVTMGQIVEMFMDSEVLKLKSSNEASFVKDKKALPDYEKNLLIASAIESNLMSQIVENRTVLLMNKELFELLTYISILIKKGIITLKQAENYFALFEDDYKELIKKSIVANIKNNGVNLESTEYAELYSECISIINGTFGDEAKFNKDAATLSVVYTLLPIANTKRLQALKLLIKNK